MKLETMEQPVLGTVESIGVAMDGGKLQPHAPVMESSLPSMATAGCTQSLSAAYVYDMFINE